MYAKWIPSIEIPEMTRYQVPREETSINLTNMSDLTGLLKTLRLWFDTLYIYIENIACNNSKIKICTTAMHVSTTLRYTNTQS